MGGVLGVVLATGVAAAAAARTAGQSSSPAPAPHGVLPRGGAAEHRAAPEGGVPSVTACRGSTPSLDGVVQRSEWADAASMLNGSGRPFARWTPEFSPVEDGRDLALTAAFVKYDSDALVSRAQLLSVALNRARALRRHRQAPGRRFSATCSLHTHPCSTRE